MTDKVEQRKTEMVDAAESLEISQEEYEKIVDECIFGKEESVSDDLEEEVNKFLGQYTYPREEINFTDFARHFAEWQKHQMIEDTIDAFIDKGSIKLCQWPLDGKYGKNRNKVKLIIIKQDYSI